MNLIWLLLRAEWLTVAIAIFNGSLEWRLQRSTHCVDILAMMTSIFMWQTG